MTVRGRAYHDPSINYFGQVCNYFYFQIVDRNLMMKFLKKVKSFILSVCTIYYLDNVLRCEGGGA